MKNLSTLFLLLLLPFFWSCTGNQEEILQEEEVVDEEEQQEEEQQEEEQQEEEQQEEEQQEEEQQEEEQTNPPTIQTPEPVIFLADNLDEQEKLGWCIDTVGRDFNSQLHAHSCKPSGGDVQFYYNEDTSQLCSAEFSGFCVEMTGGPSDGMSLSLVNSDASSPDQKFNYDTETGEFQPFENDTLCLVVGATSTEAGIYMSRTLSLKTSSSTDVSLKKWIIKGTIPN